MCFLKSSCLQTLCLLVWGCGWWHRGTARAGGLGCRCDLPALFSDPHLSDTQCLLQQSGRQITIL